jgi:hypothetical protein
MEGQSLQEQECMETIQKREEARSTMDKVVQTATHDPSARGSIVGMGDFQSMTDKSV